MELEGKDILNSQSSTSAIFDLFYPNGEMIVKNTSQSLAGPSLNRTLTTRSLSEVMNGDSLFRSPKFSGVFYNKALSSSLNSTLTAGAETAFSAGQYYEITDPEGTGSSAKLTGGAAFASVISNSIAGTNAGEDFVKSASQKLANDASTAASYPSIDSGSSNGSSSGNGTGGTGGSTVVTEDGEISTVDVVGVGVSGGSRYIVLEDRLTEEERGWINERSYLLSLTGRVDDHSYLTGGFRFDVPNDRTDLELTGTRYPGAESLRDLPSDIIQLPEKTARICPALVEMLLALSGIISYGGGVGGHRGLKDSYAVQSGGYLSDHALGRAYDMMSISKLNEPLVPFITSTEAYTEGLHILFGALNVLPMHLIPDSIIIGDKSSDSFGITSIKDLEGRASIVGQMYPNLRYVNFGPKSDHNDHVHISFSTSRTGIYSGPGGQMGGSLYSNTTGVPSSSGGGSSGGGGRDTSVPYLEYIKSVSLAQYIKDIRSVDPFGRNSADGGGGNGGNNGDNPTGVGNIPTELSDPKFTSDYSQSEGTLTVEDIFALLRLTIANDELAAVLAAISERESGFDPANLYIKRGSDWSIGLFQTSMRIAGHGSKTFYFPVTETIAPGWQLAYKDWNEDGITAENFDTEAFNKADEYAIAMHFSGPEYASKTYEEKKALLTSGKRSSAMKPHVNSACWIPINQAYMLYTTATSAIFSSTSAKLGDPGTGYALNPWGDYGGGPAYGWMENVHWKTAANLYESIGKNVADLKKYLIDMYDATGATAYNFRSQANIDRWTDGYFFPSNAEPYLET